MTEWLLEMDPATINLVMVGGFVLLMGVGVLWFLMTRGEREMKERLSRVAKQQQRPGERRNRGNPAVSLRKTDSSFTQLDKAIKQLLPNPAKMRMRLQRTPGDAPGKPVASVVVHAVHCPPLRTACSGMSAWERPGTLTGRPSALRAAV